MLVAVRAAARSVAMSGLSFRGQTPVIFGVRQVVPVILTGKQVSLGGHFWVASEVSWVPWVVGRSKRDEKNTHICTYCNTTYIFSFHISYICSMLLLYSVIYFPPMNFKINSLIYPLKGARFFCCARLIISLHILMSCF